MDQYAAYATGFYTSHGVINGLNGGIEFTGAGDFINYGIVYGQNGRGVLLAAGGRVTNLGAIRAFGGHGDGILASGTMSVVDNAGVVLSNDASGVVLHGGGYVSNTQAASKIAGATNGVYIEGTLGDVENSGTIAGTGGPGVYSVGVYVRGRGVVLNRATGTITGGYDAVRVGGGPGYIHNLGTISGTQDTGVLLQNGGTVTNEAGAGIGGGRYGVRLGGGGSVVNAGTITGGRFGVSGTGAVSVANQAGGVISGYVAGVSVYGTSGRVVNDGTITSTNTGVLLGSNGSVANAGGVIIGAQGVGILLLAGGAVQNSGVSGFVYGRYYGILAATAGRAAVSNGGAIQGGFSGIDLRVAGQVANRGGFINGVQGSGVVMEAGGAVRNTVEAGQVGQITGMVDGVVGNRERIQVLNAGVVAGNASGIDLLAGGVVTNTATGSIRGGSGAGVLVSGGNATVTNAGTISGNYAVRFTGGGHDRLILDPGGVLSGQVSGAGAHSTLELAAGRGTIAGLGSTFAGFEQVTVDRGASWRAAGTNSLANGSRLTVAGTLTVAGGLAGAAHVTIDSQSVLSVGGALGATTLAFLGGGHETARFGSAATMNAVISGFAPTDTLDLVGFAGTRLAFANDILTVTRASGGAAHLHFSGAYTGHHFTLASDGHGGSVIGLR